MNDKKLNKVEFQDFVGKRLISIMEKLQVGSTELAKRIDMEKSNIMRIRRGDVNPSGFLLYRICDALGISMEEFFEGIENSKRRPKK